MPRTRLNFLCITALCALATTLLTGIASRVDAQTLTQSPKTVYLEAESFADLGGWGLDTQSVDLVGSPYLIAHGWGTPVADATTKVEFPVEGQYRVFVRTRNWVTPWTSDYAPGVFELRVGKVTLNNKFGEEGRDWAWHEGQTVNIKSVAKPIEVALHDLTGFDGRVDAIIFTADEDFTPPDTVEELDAVRRDALKTPETAPFAADGKVYDLVVVGGGIAGTCAAIAAARLGADVALIQDRPVLGGNGSTEVRVHLNGGVNLPPYPNLGNLTYLMGPHGGGNAREAAHYKDQTRLELVDAEKSIDLYLEYRVDAAETSQDGENLHIDAIGATHVRTGGKLRFKGHCFADCTGDAALGFLAGADWSMGRECKTDYDEPSAPEQPDTLTMGSSVQWNTVETNEKTSFPELPWAIQFNDKTIRPSTHGDWDWEAGMNRDQVYDMERIRDVGLRAAYGHWSYMKNHTTGDWAQKVEKRKLNWVAYVAGKRESRRLLGPVVLREQDIVEAREFDDASVTTTWSIDLHYPEPSNSAAFPGEEFRAICKQVGIKPYAIPYRCFYSRNVDNLFMAGRDISVTHIALGTIRVMRTGGMMGEVVGMAASVCKAHDCLPNDVYTEYLDELKELMTKGVAPSPNAKYEAELPEFLKGAKNLAGDAKVTVSSNYKKGPVYPKENINNGTYDVNDNAGRWVSDYDDGHWVDLTFDKPVTVNATLIVSGQANGRTPIRDFQLQYEKDGKLVDLPKTFVTDNDSPIVGMRFPEATSKRFRLEISQSPEGLARIWEWQLYHIK